MRYLFTATGRNRLQAMTAARTLYAFDFDGSLASIVAEPGKAQVAATTSELLRSLSRTQVTAVLSGRAIEDLDGRLGFEPCYVIGNHGAQGLPGKKGAAKSARATCVAWTQQLKRLWRSVATIPGISLEDKRYSLALHYRGSRGMKRARHALYELAQKLSPAPRLLPGKAVINLVPLGAPHKGVALLELMLHARAECGFYIGDDDTDEDVFMLPDSRVTTVRVGASKASGAQFYIRRQSELNRLLRLLLALQS